VLQQSLNTMGTMQERTIIDGQQRLTTLQLLFDALHAELAAVNATAPAQRIESLVVNPQPFWTRPEDRFKVWPTNRDRPAFNAVMSATPPIKYDTIGHGGAKMVEAHRFFSEQAREWLNREGLEQMSSRATAIEKVARELLQIVVIELAADENAQEIFETLNARGAQLTAADLIKNYIFQRLSEVNADVETAYEEQWKEFETAFWEEEINVGRLKQPRSSTFFRHWLVARTGEDIVANEVFQRFKKYSQDSGLKMDSLIQKVKQAAAIYRDFVAAAETIGPITRLGLFGYRTDVLESEVVKPLILHLLDPELPKISTSQFSKSLDVVESWSVRRMLVRASTKNYNQVIAELIKLLRKEKRDSAGDVIEAFLAGQTSANRYWPDDDEVREELRILPAYRRFGRGRLRMVLEGIEDHLRGWRDGKEGLGGERVTRNKFAIEHVMPRKWAMHWPLPDGPRAESEREALLHTMGNLTLLTGKLNAKVSNGPWLGESCKKHGIETHNVLFLNHSLLKQAGDAWTESAIRVRSEELAKYIIEIWPVPEGHRSGFTQHKAAPQHKVDLSDLLSAGWLQSGICLVPRRKKYSAAVAKLLPDGRIDLDGTVHSSPSEAARSIRGMKTNGWHFFLVDPEAKRSLGDVRRSYVESFAIESDDDDEDEEGDDDA
jgi:uncharacterized protein DUF1524/uncharacterized protein DUF262/RAMA domain-containing protein